MSLIPHPLFIEGAESLSRALAGSRPGQLIFVCGLSGAGKSELRKLSMREYIGPPERWTCGRLPALAVRATPSDASYFSAKDFVGRLLAELHNPTVDWLTGNEPDIERIRAELGASETIWSAIGSKRPEHQMRLEFERLARARSLRAIFVDEAGSMTYSHRGKHPGEHMVSYMCMAEEIPVVLLLFGVPRMQALWTGNSEIRRRARFVYLRRYTKETIRDFAVLALKIASTEYPAVSEHLVRRNIELIYYATVGVMGELKELLFRAEQSRLRRGADAVEKSDLESSVYSSEELRTLHQDAELFDQLASPADLGRLLG